MGYGVKIFLASPPNYVTKSPGYGGVYKLKQDKDSRDGDVDRFKYPNVLKESRDSQWGVIFSKPSLVSLAFSVKIVFIMSRPTLKRWFGISTWEDKVASYRLFALPVASSSSSTMILQQPFYPLTKHTGE